MINTHSDQQKPIDSALESVKQKRRCFTNHPLPQIDIIGATMIFWRVRGKIIRPVPCNIVCNIIVHSAMHTHMNRPNSSLD